MHKQMAMFMQADTDRRAERRESYERTAGRFECGETQPTRDASGTTADFRQGIGWESLFGEKRHTGGERSWSADCSSRTGEHRPGADAEESGDDGKNWMQGGGHQFGE